MSGDSTLLIDRARDCSEAARRGATAATSFLTPGECAVVAAAFGGSSRQMRRGRNEDGIVCPPSSRRRFLPHLADMQSERDCGGDGAGEGADLPPQTVAAPEGAGFVFFGGYLAAERACAIFLPDYTGFAGGDARDVFIDPMYAAAREEICACVAALEITTAGRGFGRPLAHRDVLGSVLALGIKREAVGDIAVEDGGERAILFAQPKLAPFLISELDRVGGEKVAVREAAVPPAFDGWRRFTPISDTVASDRLDAVVAALTNLSRDRAAELIERGMVELRYAEVLKSDARVADGDVISVRGCGKYVVDSVGGATKKGRMRLSARKYS